MEQQPIPIMNMYFDMKLRPVFLYLNKIDLKAQLVQFNFYKFKHLL